MNFFGKKHCLAAFLACAIVVSVSAGGGKQGNDPAADGKLTVATSPDFPPYESVDAGGNYVGLDMDMARAIAGQLGLELVVVPTEFDGIVSAVSTGKADIGMSGLSVTDERKQSVDFTVNIANEPQVIMVKNDSPIKSPADLAGKRVGSQNGTTGLDLAKYEANIIAASNYPDTMGKPSAGVGYDDVIMATKDLQAGRIDAIIYDYTPLLEISRGNADVGILYDNAGKVIDLIPLYNAYITKKGNGFADKVNTAIAALKANGKLAAIYAEYPDVIPAQ
jgi:polar amino acid transport system substrate-binding protein